ncbi:LysR family transcriptional regulator [Streptomyces sp. WAC05374]|uniref:LysR family transcriptional regulator n=1 Tax=Streptomyces sp. WAC05374 TaxID=2487420 RepID=UPI000F85F2CD|nr:LysR family transcriptional regulator [Streptomyces sp. WAC05374]RST19038.1 LysR family transcriptional regulator [Streptomyces sp. WAC05374]TDF36994.1 LysR family transcriptional regulator [Streptomyces sp. WAC05374]TDF46489.1 LysR family transcriptional regulator [Streptomyces sp. WAC05374]TDF47590.1 LysR family transcriptional regulator [Streptomyces sp. WAC05374]
MARTTDSDLGPHELRVLVAVADTGGFSAAAGALGLTQSAVSHSVRGSERKIGAVLFDRGRAGARPTPAGEKAVAYARRVLRLLDVLTAEARGAAGTGVAEGPLRIAAFRSAALHLLPPVLERLRARHPGIEPRVRIVREVGRGTAGEVADGKADIAIATLGGSAPLPPGLVANGLFEEPYAVVHPVGHAAPRSLPLVDWAENCGSYTRDWWAAQEWIPTATVEAEDDGAVLALVSGGHGMAIMPALSLAGAPDSVTIADLGPRRPTRQVGYVTTSQLAGSAVVRAFVRELRAEPVGHLFPCRPVAGHD